MANTYANTPSNPSRGQRRRLTERYRRLSLRSDYAEAEDERERLRRRAWDAWARQNRPRRRRRNPSQHEWLDILVPLGLLWLVVRGQGVQLP